MTGWSIDAVVIGASAGGIDALMSILPAIPREGAWPVVTVVHVPRDKESHLVEVFQSKCALRVKEAEDKEPLLAGTLYFAPPDYHVLIEPGRTLALSMDEPVLFSRPSIDVLFESAADVYKERLLGVVLTGANADGANGLKSICEAGGQGLVQRPSTAFAREMPRAACEACPAASVMELAEIAAFLRSTLTEAPL